jgi:hypothetical protein
LHRETEKDLIQIIGGNRKQLTANHREQSWLPIFSTRIALLCYLQNIMQAVQSSNANKEETNNQVDSKKRNDGAKNSEKFVSENRLHKRRQRARNQERKQNALNELMARISSFEKTLLGKPGIFVGNLDDLYLPIPDCPLDFWGRVPKICNPNEAILNVEIADASKLSRDKMIQRKYMKKLKKKLLRGEINESERKNMWDKYGRAALNDSNGLTLLSSDRGQRKAWQIENFAFLIKNKLTRHASKESLVVADFGCGSGNLCLASLLFWQHPICTS